MVCFGHSQHFCTKINNQEPSIGTKDPPKPKIFWISLIQCLHIIWIYFSCCLTQIRNLHTHIHTHTHTSLHALVQIRGRSLQEQIFTVFTLQEAREAKDDRGGETGNREDTLDAYLITWQFPWWEGMRKGKRHNELKRKTWEEKRTHLPERTKTEELRLDEWGREGGKDGQRTEECMGRGEEMKIGKHLPGNTFARLF